MKLLSDCDRDRCLLLLLLLLRQVMDWIENHGEAFLSKHTGVGKSLHRARALQKRHDDFEDVAQVSLNLAVGVSSRPAAQPLSCPGWFLLEDLGPG